MAKKQKSEPDAAARFIARIDKRQVKAGVIGLGYVGLPLSMVLVDAGFEVIGFDVNKSRVKLLNSGQSDIDDVPGRAVARAVKSGKFKATADPKQIGLMDTISICVPTPLSKTKDPDVSFILAAMDWVAKYVKKGALIVLESTTYPGTTEDLILPLLQDKVRKAGRDFYLAFSPERVDPGNQKFTTENTPRVVGGITPACTKVAKKFYETTIPEVHAVSSTRAAEMVKLLENTFRSVNIGLVNEVALMCHRLGIDVWEIIDAAATKPFGFMPFYPGPGLGGHCIPIDPHYLSWKLKSLNYYARFIELAGDINSQMPEWVVDRISAFMNKRFTKALNKSSILMLGVTYKRDIKDTRESPALDVWKLLENRGAKVQYHDPYVPHFRWGERTSKSVKLTASAVKKADLVVIATDHTSFDYQWIADNARAVFDTRNATRHIRGNRGNIELL
ncbi:MAG: nucleotide sugar dehydrogenase [Candidatus Zixiibacteriota bacterium]|nr:MAG: nucleotide sugar dehydrogenase [candidate division Zixibacteria bacterium]